MPFTSPVDFVARWDALVEALEDARAAGHTSEARALQRAITRLEAGQTASPTRH